MVAYVVSAESLRRGIVFTTRQEKMDIYELNVRIAVTFDQSSGEKRIQSALEILLGIVPKNIPRLAEE